MRKGIALWRANKYNRIFLRKNERKAINSVLRALLIAGKGLPTGIIYSEVRKEGVGERSAKGAILLLQIKRLVNVNQPAGKRVRYVTLNPRGRKWYAQMRALKKRG